MPNLRRLIELHNTYGAANNKLTESKLASLNESFDWHHFDGGTGNSLRNYFETNPKEKVVLLFIDVTNFSNKIFNLSNTKIKVFLDQYYNQVMPIIYKYGGEIEKTIGDAVICVFGRPFLDSSLLQLVRAAELCSKEIIELLKNTIYESKIAMHYGEIMYYKCSATTNYEEFTMIGNALTELHRLESVSENNSINFYERSVYDNYLNKNYSKLDLHWDWYYKIPVNLKGVPYNSMGYCKRK